MWKRLRTIAQHLKREVAYLLRLRAHPDTPWVSRWLLWLAIAYALSPLDLIPDWIPVVGHLDDLVIVPGLVGLAFLFIPKRVREEARAQDPPSSS